MIVKKRVVNLVDDVAVNTQGKQDMYWSYSYIVATIFSFFLVSLPRSFSYTVLGYSRVYIWEHLRFF